MKLSPSVFIVLAFYFSSCSSPEKDFKGLWRVQAENDIVFVEINDSLINFRFPASECDSTFKTFESVSYEIETGSSDEVKLDFEFEGKPVESEFELIHENSALWVWTSPERDDSVFASAVRTNFKFTENIPESERRLSGYQSFVYEKADSLNQLSNRLAQNVEVSAEAADALNYIDTLKQQLLDPLEKKYSNPKCAFMDLELNKMFYASDILVGEKPIFPNTDRYSASVLKQRLQEYSKSINQEQILEIYPEFATENFDRSAQLKSGRQIPWELYHFFRVPSALTLLKLNEFQLKIYRIEKIRGLLA